MQMHYGRSSIWFNSVEMERVRKEITKYNSVS